MKPLITLVAAAVLPLIAFAQNVHPAVSDSTNHTADADTTRELQEIVIKSSKVIRKADMDLFYPSASAVEYAKNGVQLVRNLMIPGLSVNEAMGTITTAGESVEVYINGRVATIEQVKMLLPETVKRVEWMDNPGLRYKGANAVLNFIVTNPTQGGSLMFDGMQALNTAWGEYSAEAKLNNGRSQWGISAHHKITNHVACYREYTETFTYEDGTSLTRDETPQEGGYTNHTFSGLQVDYSYIRPDTTTFWVALHGYRLWTNRDVYKGLMSLSSGADDIRLLDYSADNGFTPSLRAYLEQHFAHQQTLAIDVNAQTYGGRSARTYTEHDALSEALLNDVHTSIKDRNQAYGAEADYIKKWKTARLTAGLSYTANRNRSTYENLNDSLFHQRQDQVYFFGEYAQSLKRLTLTVGLGAQYTDFKFRETGQGNHSWNLRPQFSATYRHNDASLFMLNFASWQIVPTLAQTNIAVSQTDGIQWRVGNPDLKTASAYQLSLRYKYTFDRLSGQFSVRALNSPDAIASYLYWDGDRLMRSYENSRGLRSLGFTLAPEWEVIPNWLTLDGTLSYRMERSKGNGYEHTNHNWSGDVDLTLTHWNFALLAQYQKGAKTLSGETYSWGESLSLLMLFYNWKNWQFGGGMLFPFNKYEVGNQSLNRYNSNKTNLRLDMATMPLVKVAYNLQWGRQKRGVEKMASANAHVETSSAGGR
jgi:hypothetical protein